ncbi:hypothetical protein HS041_14700 [Planomonospora sp. ID67723]|uniref:hypothetical protein n=1 Tax=Planomonospora sp. ID67723 TaxID=2738134 RepID=UPI0018C3D7F3|nr:hypothetical protein [Planomonospora sp. ID67723]MBG0829020.1 hypothetical protein [Planomonospora sp. ID67723]
MNGRSGTFVESNYGATHTGDGDQYVTQHISFTQLAQAAGKDPRRIAGDQLAWLRKRFVPPPGLARARRVLECNGTVFLDGAPGAGRRSAAWMLLNELYSGRETFHEILPDEDGGQRCLDLDQVGDDALILVDLSASADEQTWSKVQGELHDLRVAAHDHAARLVVVLPAGTAGRLQPDLSAFRIEITRPPEQTVFQRYLRAADIPVAETDSSPEPLSDFLAGAPSMRKIADLAELVVEARERSESGFAAWCEDALAVLDNRQSTRVTEKLTILREGPQRALLLATAMMHGARAEAIHRATAALLREVGHPQADLPLLEHTDLTVRLKEIDSSTDASGRVRFGKFGYDSAVRSHFWTHWPELRKPIQKWVTGIVDLPGLEQSDRDELVKRFAQQCLRDGHPNMLLDLVWQCTGAPVTRFRLEASVQALRHGLGDEAHGRFFRQRILDAARSSVSRELAQVLTVTCWKMIAAHHPDQALVRLHHLARRETGTAHARDALAQIVGSDTQLRIWMLKRLVHRLQSENERWRRFDADLFLELADPIPLTAPGPHAHSPLSDPGVQEQLTAGWHLVFLLCSYEVWRPQAQHWFRAALEDEAHRGPLLDVLIRGGGQRTDLLAPLYVAARDLASSSADGQERSALFTGLVRQKIDTVLGLRGL